jgi:myosin-5
VDSPLRVMVVLESNPILEAFGNARTVRNDNSSRFGKFIELQFKHTGSLVGAKIETYLLEKVRLVHQAEGERNFHVFYGLIKAAMDDERELYMLGDYTIQDFKMTGASGCFDRRDGVDDEEMYDELVMALGIMGFESDTMNDILCCTAAFLHAYNLTFASPTEDSSKVDDSNPHLEPALKLLGLDKDAFNSAICEYEVEIRGETFTHKHNAEGALKVLEAFIKGTYGAMFDFIVSNVNKRIDHKPAKGAPKLSGKAAAISVLDIFGFESFQSNSFEQLCINYCNEALQQQFNLFIFKNEQAEYKREGTLDCEYGFSVGLLCCEAHSSFFRYSLGLY